MAGIEERLRAIEERNSRVEADKAWETSLARRALITIFTYLVASWIFYSIGVKDPFFNALVPTGVYALSTLSLPFIKAWWLRRAHK